MDKKNKLSFFAVIFFALYMVLPEYFALELSSSLPLITGSRILLILLLIYYVAKNDWKIHFKIFYNDGCKKYFVIYFVCMIITNLYYALSTKEAIKELFIIILEELVVLWLIVKIVNTREKMDKVLKIIAISSAITAIISIIGTITGNNLFYYLNTVSRKMLMASFYRLGFIRAEAGFGHAVYYALYCIMMIPICMYLLEKEKNNCIYIICFALNIIGLVLANSRGPLLIFACMSIYMFCRKKTSLIQKYIPMLFLSIILIIFLFLTNDKIENFVKNIFISLTNVFKTNVVSIEDYGGNDGNGIDSRLNQYSMVQYAMKKNFLFGLGANAHIRGVQMWYNTYTERWQLTNTYDVGYFLIICTYGIIGLLGNLVLYYGIIINTFKSKFKRDSIIEMFKYIFIIYFLGLFAVTGINNVFWIILSLFIAYLNILNLESTKNDI